MLNQIDLASVDLNLLVLFDVVLAESHVGRAAARLHLSPSAVSHGLGRLRRLLHDPLFLKHPKGVVPTARASALAGPIADVLAGVRRVVETAEPFDPSTSRRRFVVGAPDALAPVILGPFFAAVRRAAPGIDLGMRNVMAPFGAALGLLDARELDIAVLPLDEVPARFAAQALFEERFRIGMRRGHKLGRAPTLARYAAAEHVLVSATGDPYGNIDEALDRLGRKRRVTLAVPTFMVALSVIAESDIVGAIPSSLLRTQADRFGLVTAPLPFELPVSFIHSIVPQAALSDAGIAWLVDVLATSIAP